MIILFLNENPLPPVFTRGTISAKELRLRAAIKSVDQIHVIASRGKPVTIPDHRIGTLEEKVIVHLLPPWPYYLISIPLFFYGIYYCLKLKPHIIEAESPIFSGPIAVILGKLFSIPSVVEVRSTFSAIIQHKLTFLPLFFKQIAITLTQNFALKQTDAIIANSHYYQRQLLSQNLHSWVINPGLQYPPRHLPPRRKSRNSPLVIGYLGRLTRDKGAHLLIEAIAHLDKNIDIPIRFPIEVHLAGDGSAKQGLIDLVNQHPHIRSQIKFLGFQPNYSFLDTIDILVNPCLVSAPLEMVNVEAASRCLPVICFGDNQQPETVVDQRTGIIVRQQSAHHLAQAIAQLINNPNLRHQFGHAGLEFSQKYQFTQQVTILQALYDSLLPSSYS